MILVNDAIERFEADLLISNNQDKNRLDEVLVDQAIKSKFFVENLYFEEILSTQIQQEIHIIKKGDYLDLSNKKYTFLFFLNNDESNLIVDHQIPLKPYQGLLVNNNSHKITVDKNIGYVLLNKF